MFLLTAAACQDDQVTRAEIEVSIDTDVPLPAQAADEEAVMTTVRIDRLRIDVLASDGVTEIESRDFAVGDPALWPVSFGVHSEPDDSRREFRLRVRAYRAGYVQDGDEADDGVGRTRSEPRPAFAIDRVTLLRLVPGERRRVTVFLHGDCMGVAANAVQASSCLEPADEPELEDVRLTAAEPRSAEQESQVGTWQRAEGEPCEGEPRRGTGQFDEEVCIEGGVFHLGDDRVTGLPCDVSRDTCDAVPERVVALRPFYIDRFPVTVGRYRAALRDARDPLRVASEFEQPVLRGDPRYTISAACTWTGVEPENLAGYVRDPRDDDRPLNCITAAGAEAFCRWAGGTLPSEAQWEFVATAWGRPFKTLYPWGDGEPNCEGVATGRAPADALGSECVAQGFAPGIPALTELQDARVPNETPAGRYSEVGVAALGAPTADVLLDSSMPYDDDCWLDAPRIDPVCRDRSAGRRSVRGGGYLSSVYGMQAAARKSMPHEDFGLDVGVRCVRSAERSR